MKRLKIPTRIDVQTRQALQRADLHNRTLVLSEEDMGSADRATVLQRTDDAIVIPADGTKLQVIAVSALVASARWLRVPEATYTGTPASTSRITMASTAGMAVGLPLAYVIGGTAYFGITTAVSANAYVDVAGAPLGGAITDLRVGLPEMVVHERFFVEGTYGDGAADLLDADGNTAFRWERGAAYLVAFAAKHKTNDATGNPKVNLKVAGNLVSTNDSNNGVQVSTTWVANSAVAVNASYYGIARGDAVEVRCTVAGGTGDAAHLTVSAAFVLA